MSQIGGSQDTGQDGPAERVTDRTPLLVFGGSLVALIAAVAAVVVIFRASGLAEAEIDFAGSQTTSVRAVASSAGVVHLDAD